MRHRSFAVVALLATGIAASAGCSTVTEEEELGEESAEAISRGVSKWAVDMKKVRATYGATSKYFFGQAAEETPLKDAYAAMGISVVWDQTFHRDLNHEAVPETDTQNDVAVILEDGTKVAPTGYVNIVPLLKNTDPSKQVELRKVMQDGDVIVYFHPEYSSVKDQMERRASHVAMHYDYKGADGREYVHHIDNPNGYGPQYNHDPRRRMPFHVFRFLPKKTKVFRTVGESAPETIVADGVTFTKGQAKRTLDYLNDATKTQAKMTRETRIPRDAARTIINARRLGALTSLEEVARLPQVSRRTIERLLDTVGGAPEPGTPSTDMTIDADLAKAYGKASRTYGFMDNDTSPFADFFTLNLQKKEDLSKFLNPVINGQNLPNLYCSGLAYTNLNLAINHPKNQNGLDAALWEKFSTSKYGFSDSSEQLTKTVLGDDARLRGLDRLVFEPYGALDILNNWIDVYMAKLPLPLRQQLLQNPQLQQAILGGMSQLAWSGDAAKPSSPRPGETVAGPANPANVKRWAAAYGLGADKTQAFLDADAELKTKFATLNLPTDGLTPMDILQAVEKKIVSNRFVPPKIWMDEVDREDSEMVYVATVLNCEMLSAKDGSRTDACSGGDQGSDEFKEGAADTTTYPDYKIANGKELAHRRFSVLSGPEQMGNGTFFNLRFSHADVSDVKFVVHTAELWKGHPLENLPLVELYRKCNELYAENKVCTPDIGILLDPAKLGRTGAITEGSLDFKLEDVCTFTSETEMECPTLKRGADNKWTDGGTKKLSRGARGGINVTMIDLGASAAAAEIPRCDLCSQGGGHFNGWNVRIRNER